jgi:hypothetical protein
MICPLLRGSARFACTLIGFLASLASLPAQTPQGRILNTFNGTLSDYEPILETETMIACAETHMVQEWNGQHEEWWKVRFWDKDGSNYSERMIPAGKGASGSPFVRCKAEGNDLFFPSGGSFYRVNRNPAIPIDWVGYIDDTLCDLNDQYAVVRIKYAQDWDGIKFFDRQTFQQVGRVATTLRVQELTLRDDDIVFTSRDGKGKYHLHRMPYPDFSRSDVVKSKISALPGAYESVSYFGEDFAVVQNWPNEYIIRYSDPAKKGKPGIYPVKEAWDSATWLECNGTLARWVGQPEPSLHHVEFSNGSYTLKPVGLPPGLLNSRVLSAGADSIYITNAVTYGGYQADANWVNRLSFALGRQLSVAPVVADERDGVMRFTVKLDDVSTEAVTFSYETAGGSAVSGTDFTAVSGTASIAAGEREVHIDVPLTEDFSIERPESFELRITTLSGALCDTPSAVGRIRGSGSRLVEEVANDSGGFVVGTLDTTTSRADARHSFLIGATTVNARKLGFEAFWPVADGADGFRYARALPLGSDDMKLCQFDGATGELLEVFDHAPFSAQGAELVLGKGAGFVRYSFYDGLPVLSLAGLVVPEGPEEKQFTLRSERTHQVLDLAAVWSDPGSTLGEPSLEQQPSGDILFTLAGGEEQPQAYDFTVNLSTTLSAQGIPGTFSMLVPVVITEDDIGPMTFVPGTATNGESLAASGNRVWSGGEGGKLLESFVFQGGTLSAGIKVSLPAGTELRPDIPMRGYNENHAIATNGDSVFAGARKGPGTGYTFVSGVNTTKPKARHVFTKSWPLAQVASESFVVTAYGPLPVDVPRRVEVRQAKTNKVLKSLQADLTQGFFGFSLAITDKVLWISSPQSDKVDGYNLTTFTQVRSITSPAAVSGGVFGYSIAAQGPYLVVGEPSNTAPGAVWVFSADGQLVKKLSSGVAEGKDGFGSQVATRGGRILVGSGLLDGPASGGYHEEDPGGHRPVMLWNTPEADPIRLVSSFAGSAAHDSGYAIALLDGCAVVAAMSEFTSGVEYYAFPPAAALAKSDASGGAATVAVPGWPVEGSPDPVWSFAKAAGGGMEVSVDLGGALADPAAVVMEWSGDLIEWVPLADAQGANLAAAKVATITAGEGTLKVEMMPDAAGKGFFRMRKKE